MIHYEKFQENDDKPEKTELLKKFKNMENDNKEKNGHNLFF